MAKPKDTSKLIAMNAARRLTNDQVFVEDSSYARHHIKRRILEDNLLEYICSGCDNTGVWNNEPLVLQLEHKNGISTDHRISNLEFLCPNCHSQTKTYAAKNRKNPARKPKSYIDKNGLKRNIYS